MTAKQIHALQPGDRVRARKTFQGANGKVPAGRDGIVQVVIVELYLDDRQAVTGADIKWRGGLIENLQDHELKRWVMPA